MIFLGVFIGSTDAEIRNFVDTYRLTFPVGKDNGISGTFGVNSLPMTLFIGRDGRIARRQWGSIDAAALSAGVEVILRDGDKEQEETKKQRRESGQKKVR